MSSETAQEILWRVGALLVGIPIGMWLDDWWKDRRRK